MNTQEQTRKPNHLKRYEIRICEDHDKQIYYRELYADERLVYRIAFKSKAEQHSFLQHQYKYPDIISQVREFAAFLCDINGQPIPESQ